MKMRNLLFGVFLGLLAVVRSTPVAPLDAVEKDFLADEYLLPSLTTESPKRNATVPATQQPMSEFKESDMTEGSGATTTPTSTTTVLPDDANRVPQSSATSPSDLDEALFRDDDVIEDTTVKSTTPMFFLHKDEHYKSTTPSVPHAQSSTSTPFPMPADDFNSHSSGITSPSESDEALSTDNDAIEDTAIMSTNPIFFPHEDEQHESTTPSVPHAQSSTSTPFPLPSDDFISRSSTTRAPQSGVTSPSDADDDLSTDDVSNDHNSASQTTDAAISSSDLSSGDGSGEGSGSTELSFPFVTTTFSTTSTSTAKTSTTSSPSEPRLVPQKIDNLVKQDPAVLTESKGQVQKNTQPDTPDSPTTAGHSTPAWIIIVGFIVSVAALVMLCVAIATRDKWNAPRQAPQPKANPSNQQRELEMETFLHKDNPRENGKAAEYTVIPLDELPEKYSSH